MFSALNSFIKYSTQSISNSDYYPKLETYSLWGVVMHD